MEDSAPEQRLSDALELFAALERQRDVPEEYLDELRAIVDDFARAVQAAPDRLSPEFEMELTERLFSLYVDISDGVLIC